MNTNNDTSKPEDSPEQEAGEGCSGATCSALLDAALGLLAGWCDAVKNGGTGWDDWDEWYKDAYYRPGPLRELIDVKMKEIENQNAEDYCPKCGKRRVFYDGWNCPTEGCDSLPNADGDARRETHPNQTDG